MNYKKGLKKDIEGWLARFFLRELCRLGPYFMGNRTSKEIDSLNFLRKEGYKFFHEAYANEHRVVWTSLFVPSEILFALGLIPLSLEVIAALFAGAGQSPKGLAEAEAEGIPTDVCTFHRSALGFAFKGYLPRPIIHATTSTLCDSNIKMSRIGETITGKETLVLDVPYDLTKESIRYLSTQLEEFTKKLEAVAGRRMDPQRLREVLERANRTREKMLEINEIRTSPFSPLPGTKTLGFMLPSHVLQGSSRSEEFYTRLAAELKETVSAKEKSGASPEEKIRLLWLELKPYFKCEIPTVIETNSDMKIAFEETNYVYWEPLDPQRPYESLARKLISNHYNGPLDRRIAVLKTLVKKYDIDGAIIFSHWGCRRNNAAVPVIKRELNLEGIPVMNLDGDCVDDQNFTSGQLKTRLEGFMEMLRCGGHSQSASSGRLLTTP
ncbi:MAG: 2-hydroxyacyl-CoA dehydratase [Planctomycetes bacterium]|nr:2-hydroxyacyl-CoA dehydratase [Planctomycetota bacterium]